MLKPWPELRAPWWRIALCILLGKHKYDARGICRECGDYDPLDSR